MAVLVDRRLHGPRLRAHLKAQIVLPLETAIHCFITEISPAGARLDIDPHEVLPSVFAIQILGDETLFYCDLVWRRDRDTGVTISPDQWRFWRARSQAFSRSAASEQPFDLLGLRGRG
jgi:hypothetical protein